MWRPFPEGFLAAELMPAGANQLPWAKTIAPDRRTRRPKIAADQASAPSSSAAAVAAPLQAACSGNGRGEPGGLTSSSGEGLVAQWRRPTRQRRRWRRCPTPNDKLQPTAGWWHTAGQRSWPRLGVALESLRGSGPHGRMPGRGRGAAQRPAAGERAPGHRKAAVPSATCHRLRWQATEPRRRAAGAAPPGQGLRSPAARRVGLQPLQGRQSIPQHGGPA